MWTTAAFSTQFTITTDAADGLVAATLTQRLPYARPLEGIEDLLLDIGEEANIELLGLDNTFCEVKRADDWQVWLGPIRLIKVGPEREGERERLGS